MHSTGPAGSGSLRRTCAVIMSVCRVDTAGSFTDSCGCRSKGKRKDSIVYNELERTRW